MGPMWKHNPSPRPSFNPVTEPARPTPPTSAQDLAARNRAEISAGDQATISKGLIVKGEITGTESLFIDGKVEGSINLPNNRVTVGHNGQVAGSPALCINAKEIVVMGKIHGNVSAADRIDIRAEGALTGDVSASRISIEDGAFFRGAIDIRKAEPSADVAASPAAPKPAEPRQTLQ